MGYETRLHIGMINDYGSGDKCGWNEIATIDLCKVAYHEMGNLIQRVRDLSNPQKVDENYIGGFKFTEIYVRGREEAVCDDSYGDALVAVPAEAVLYAMRHDNSKEPYRRYPPAIALLQSIVDNFERRDILHTIRVLMHVF